MRGELLGEEVEDGEGLVVANIRAAASVDEGRIVGGAGQAVRVGQDEAADTFPFGNVDGNRLEC